MFSGVRSIECREVCHHEVLHPGTIEFGLAKTCLNPEFCYRDLEHFALIELIRYPMVGKIELQTIAYRLWLVLLANLKARYSSIQNVSLNKYLQAF